jgi:phosphohistidine phosphatase SixA
MTNTVTVSKQTLQRLLDYISHDEARHYDECEPDEQEGHIYHTIQELKNSITLGEILYVK